jgi:hypothetical protein
LTWSDIQFHPTEKTLRQFAGLFLLIFGALAVYETVWGGSPRLGMGYGVAAALVGGAGLIWPKVIQPVFVGWSIVAFPIGWAVSTLLLGVLFYGIFTPLGLVFRATGRDVLRLRRPATATYWLPKAAAKDPREYFRQS